MMANIRTIDMALIEDVFEMGSGYVLDFSDRTMSAFFAEELDAVELTDDSVAMLRWQGWSEETLRHAQKEGDRYSPSRNNMLLPVMSSDVFDKD